MYGNQQWNILRCDAQNTIDIYALCLNGKYITQKFK